MKVHVEKMIDVDIELNEKERDLIIDCFNLLEKIQDRTFDEGLMDDDDEFTLSWVNELGNYHTNKKSVEDLSVLIARFDEFI